MPTVKTYEAQQATSPMPDVHRSGTPIPQLRPSIITAQPNAESFGVAYGESALRTGGQIFGQELQVRDQLRQKAKVAQDRVRILDADQQLSAWESGALYDPQNGALNKTGKDAFGLPETVSQDFEKTYGAIWQGLSNDEQRQAFDQLAQTRRRDVSDTVLRHVSGQLRQYEADTQASYLQNSREAAAANATDPLRVQTEIQRQRIAISSFGVAHGVNPETTQRDTAAAVSQTHVDVLNNLLAAGQDLNAKTYYDHNKDDILGTSRAPIERNLTEGSQRGESQRQADRILQTAATQGEAMDAAKAIADPEIRDLVTSRVDAEWRLRKQIQRDNDEATMNQAKDALDQTMGQMENLIDTRKPVFARDVIPPSVWTTLPDANRKALESYARQYQEKGSIETDAATYYSLKLQAADHPQDFAKVNLLDSMQKLDKTAFKDLVDLQATIRKGNLAEADKQLDDFRTENQVINETLGSMGIDAGAKENNAAVSRVHAMVAEQAGALAVRSGKKPTNADIQGIVDNIVSTPEFVPGYFYGSTEKPLVAVTVKDISGSERKKIEDALRDAHRVVTDDSVLDLYIRTQQRLKKK